MKFFFNKKLFRTLFWIWLIVIVTVSSIPDIPTTEVTVDNTRWRLDYFFHFCEYGFLSLLLLLWRSNNEFRIPWAPFLWIMLTGVLFGIGDELHQHFIPGRTVNLNDMLSNAAGWITGLLFTRFIIFPGLLIYTLRKNT